MTTDPSTINNLATIVWARKCAEDAMVTQDGITYSHSVTKLSADDVLTLCDLASEALETRRVLGEQVALANAVIDEIIEEERAEQ